MKKSLELDLCIEHIARSGFCDTKKRLHLGRVLLLFMKTDMCKRGISFISKQYVFEI